MTSAIRLLKQVLDNPSIIDRPGWLAEARDVVEDHEQENLVESLLLERTKIAANQLPDFDTRAQRKILSAHDGEAVDVYRRSAERADQDAAYEKYIKRVEAAEAAGETVATLQIGLRMATCSACGGNASEKDERHISGGPKPDGSAGSSLSDANGCGALFIERRKV